MGEWNTMRGWGFWGWVDYVSHRPWLPVPAGLQAWICDKFDEALGLDAKITPNDDEEV